MRTALRMKVRFICERGEENGERESKETHGEEMR